MSQNRGYRRDGRQSYQMNSSAHYGRSGQQMNVNPWEGGLVPGGRSGVAGLLPTPPQSSNLLSQLSSPEAQLALASNLLSTLLRPQQPSPEVPSLLSLGSLGHLGNSAGGSGYRQHSGYGPGRYQDPGPNRRKRMESRRQEPYSKPTQGRRPAPARGGPERKPGGNQGLRSPSIGKSRSGSGTKPGGKADRKDDDKEPKKDKDQEDDKSSGAEKKTDEEDVKRDEGEDGEKKRDWKDEKKSEDLSGGDKDENGEDKEKDEKDKDVVEKVPTSRYSGIPPALFYCHVCKKHMWDDNSFQNHLKGRTHQLMMDKLEESYKIRVELMRHEQKVAEQQREIEMERMKRQGKKVNMNIREYCTMCDLHFFGNLIVHRKNDRHQQLKNFLHPRCLPCGKEFPTRVEWDHHKLTPLHLKKTAEARKNRKSGSDDEFGIEELISGGGGFGDDFSKRDIKVRTREEEEDEIKEADKMNETDVGTEKSDRSDGAEKSEGVDKDAEGKDEGETTVIGNLRFRVPKYNPEVAVGLSLLKKMTGQTCRACHRFFINVEDAKTHCRTLMHYNNFVELVKEKAKAAEAKERREAKAEAKKREGSLEKTEKATKRSEDMSTVDDEGNWKRRKVANAEEEDEDADVSTATDGGRVSEAAATDPVVKEEISETAPTNGSQKYDPLEADAEESNPEDENKDTQSQVPAKDEEEEKVKVKKENSIIGDDNLWAEVDRDIGSLLDTVDGEGETESLNDMMEDDLLTVKQETDSPAKGSRNSTRNKATRGSLAAKSRGRKKK